MHKLTLLALFFATGLGCGDFEPNALDFDFEISRAEVFPESLSEYGLFAEPAAELTPTEGTYLYELSSELFTDYAGKQRLIRVPEGATVTVTDGMPTYPEGTLMAKTFYFDADLNDASKGRKIVETRLLVKREGEWNVATYLWNAEQTDAVLSLDGSTADVSFLDKAGNARSTGHEVPSEVACVTCHQNDGEGAYIGPKLKNLERQVERDGQMVNQLEYLASVGVLPASSASSVAMVDYRDTSKSLEDRARSYMDINCAHCHNPGAWERSANKDLDLRYEVELAETGIPDKLKPLRRQVEEGEMPFIGTTLLHEEGVALLLEYFAGI